MFKNMKLRTKLIGSFFIVALITLTVGYFGWRGVNNLSEKANEIGKVRLPSVASLLVIKKEAETVIVAQRTLLNPDLTKEDKSHQSEYIADARKTYEAAWEKYESLPKTPDEAALWSKLVAAWGEWKSENNSFFATIKELETLDLGNPGILAATMERIRGDHYKLLGSAVQLIAFGVEFEGGEDPATCNFGKWVASFKTENQHINKTIEEISLQHKNFHKAVADIKKAVSIGNVENAKYVYRNALEPAAKVVFEGLEVLNGEANKGVELFSSASQYAQGGVRAKQLVATGLLDQIIKLNEKSAEEAVTAGELESTLSKTIANVGMIAGFLVALGLGIFLSATINRALARIIVGLEEGADQVASASSQVSSASQSLAEGSSEQAAAIEETSSSLEEMSSMTRQNADNANQADTLMKEANLVVNSANQSMAELTRSMSDISKASEETSKIIKTIDEIAFQTNLLALNAAVEAARAGEAGAGFAVVADEVRNLAMRAADAAKNTAGLIEGTVKQVKEGGELVAKTNENFMGVARGTARIGELIAEIAAASSEQAQGISQVNTAVNEVDKVTQQNAANAEESASAAEEMNAQALQMKGYVHQLVAMVGASKNEQTPPPMPRLASRVVHTETPRLSTRANKQALEEGSHRTKEKEHQKKQWNAGSSSKPNPDDVIPMDRDFEDF